ncbi:MULTISPECIES: competence type IV pilus major pilin ComGC [Sinobaca]|uniref:ComG operon protein 3 n=1 Tax=Sinobaca qinghaiensis TaxID=342944 RepID=A0A419V379_9BACL|nr:MULTISPECIES: competence type IV pilus major pilin ComGC [Sinobaca]RKD72985.1 competence protein ComGC [Sinobaca qinghaiensis]
MKKRYEKEAGFTMVEMLIVLLIITVLLLIAIPNVVTNNGVAQNKGCDATIKLLESQAAAYAVEFNKAPASLSELQEAEYVDRITCPDESTLVLENGKVRKGS